ncbi:MAG: hypothetical protein ACYSTG_06515 [Planctomycetota bacterium]
MKRQQKTEAIFQTGVRDEEIRKAKRSAIAAVFLGVGGVVSLICSSKAGFPSTVLWQYASILLFVSAAVVGIVSTFSWIGSKESGHSSRLSAVAVKIFLFGVVLFILGACSGSRRFLWGFLILSFIVAPALGIIGTIISVRGRGLLVRVLAMLLIFILVIPLAVGGGVSLVWLLPRIYTPPALTHENIVVYNECIEFAKNHDEYKDLVLRRGFLFDGDENISVESAFLKGEAEELQRKLFSVRCARFQRNNDMLLFYNIANSVSMLSRSWPRFLPARPGVLYSLNGQNPSEIDSEVLNKAKPLVKIGGDWYMSRKLMMTGPRLSVQTSIPESLIDHSLRATELDLDGEI